MHVMNTDTHTHRHTDTDTHSEVLVLSCCNYINRHKDIQTVIQDLEVVCQTADGEQTSPVQTPAVFKPT